MTFPVVLGTRDFKSHILDHDLQLFPQTLSWSAKGGPKIATVSVRGGEEELKSLINYLRCPIEIYNDSGVLIWWGFVFKIRLRIRNMEVVVSLGPMANRIVVGYTYLPSGASGSEMGETTWVSDANSIASYGTRERRFTMSNTSPDAALNRANTILEEIRLPKLVWGFSDAEASLSAHLECHGWWDSLAWKYLPAETGEESYVETGTGTQEVGITATQKVVQWFVPASTPKWKADRIHIRVRKTGAPSDNLKVSLVDNAFGILATGNISPASMSSQYQWLAVDLSATVSLAGGTTYGVLVERTGALSSVDYYAVDVVEPPSFTPGAFQFYNGTVWGTRSPDADMPFRVTGVQETTSQIEDIITATGQFFTGIRILDSSGIYTNPYQSGDRFAKAVVEDLLNTGTSAQRPLLAAVHPDRSVDIFEAPPREITVEDQEYLLTAEGTLTTEINEYIDPTQYPVGVWARAYDLFPADIQAVDLENITQVFIEEVTYDVVQARPSFVFAEPRSLRDLGSIGDG